jgi:hypothetical protein
MSGSHFSRVLVAVVLVGACFEQVDVDEGVGTGTGGETEAGETEAGETGADETGPDDTGDDAAAACSEYCTLVGDHCQGDALAQYTGTLACQETCIAMAPGTPGAMTGNTRACRREHAILAGRDPVVHCPHAGPSGGDLCGGACESFCALAVELCTGEHEVWPNVEACATDCVQFPSDPPYAASVQDGDSYACRLAHLTLAALQPEVHCPHVKPDSDTCF